MNVQKHADRWFITQTGLTHPVDHEPVEFFLRRHAAGAYAITAPDKGQPETDVQIAVEPSDPAEQTRINDAGIFELAGWAISELRDYYAQ